MKFARRRSPLNASLPTTNGKSCSYPINLAQVSFNLGSPKLRPLFSIFETSLKDLRKIEKSQEGLKGVGLLWSKKLNQPKVHPRRVVYIGPIHKSFQIVKLNLFRLCSEKTIFKVFIYEPAEKPAAVSIYCITWCCWIHRYNKNDVNCKQNN